MMKPITIATGTVSGPKLSRDGRTMLVSIPISMRKTGGRKKVITPPDAWSPSPISVDETIVKALARAHRWRGMLESRLFDSVRELAKGERINEAYLGRVLRLTLLSPKITETILSGRQHAELQLAELLKPFSGDWEAQEAQFLK